MSPDDRYFAMVLAVAIIAIVVMIAGVTAHLFWLQIRVWLFAKLDQASEPIDPNDRGGPL